MKIDQEPSILFNNILCSPWSTFALSTSEDMFKEILIKYFNQPNIFGIEDDIPIVKIKDDGHDHDTAWCKVVII